MVTEYYVRPGAADQVPYASGANDGSSYANAWQGLNNANFRTAANTASNAMFWICGSHRALQGSPTTYYNIPIASGVSRSKPKIFRGDYPGDPGSVWGGYIPSGSWTSLGGDVFTVTAQVANTSYDSEAGVHYAAYLDGTTERILTKVASSAACDATANTFFLDTGSTIRVHLGSGETPTGKVMFAQYGHQFQFTRADAPLVFVHFHALRIIPMARMAMVDIGGTSYIAKGITFSGCRVTQGAKNLFTLRRASEWQFETCELGHVSNDGVIYAKTTARDDANNTLASGSTRLQIYNTHRLGVYGCQMHDAGMVYSSGTADSHLVGLQAIDESSFLGNDWSWSRAPYVHWHTNEAEAIQDNIEVAYNSVHHLHNGVSADTSTKVRGIATESGDAGNFSNRRIHHNWIGGLASMTVTPTYPPHALRGQSAVSLANAPEYYGNKVVDMPIGICMPSNAPYTNYHDNIVVDPTGHTISRYALGQSGLYATSICDMNTYSGLTDEATMFGNAGVNESSAPSSAVSKTNWINPTGSYRFDVNSTFDAIELSPLSIDFGAESAAGVIVAEAA